MTEVQVFAWRRSAFSASSTGKQERQAAVAFGDANATVTLARDAEAHLLLVDTGVDRLDCDLDHTALAADLTIGPKTFPRGSRLTVLSCFEDRGQMSERYILARLTTQDDMAIDLVFATGRLYPGASYTVAPVSPSHDRDHTSLARGTLIDTPHGPMPIEHLEDGDEVLTRDGRVELISDLCRHRVSGLELALMPGKRPIRIAAGALVGGLPGTDLTVSQGQRLLLNDWRAPYLFGEDEILVPARSLLDGRNVTIECPKSGIEYFQIVVEGGEMACANGLWAETTPPDQSAEVDVTIDPHLVERGRKSEINSLDSDHYRNSVPALPIKSATALAA